MKPLNSLTVAIIRENTDYIKVSGENTRMFAVKLLGNTHENHSTPKCMRESARVALHARYNIENTMENH